MFTAKFDFTEGLDVVEKTFECPLNGWELDATRKAYVEFAKEWRKTDSAKGQQPTRPGFGGRPGKPATIPAKWGRGSRKTPAPRLLKVEKEWLGAWVEFLAPGQRHALMGQVISAAPDQNMVWVYSSQTRKFYELYVFGLTRVAERDEEPPTEPQLPTVEFLEDV